MVLQTLKNALNAIGGQHPHDSVTPKPFLYPSIPSEENIFITYRYNLELAVKAMRAKGIDPLDQMPYGLRQRVFTGAAILDDILDYMAEEGYCGCSTTFMRPV